MEEKINTLEEALDWIDTLGAERFTAKREELMAWQDENTRLRRDLDEARKAITGVLNGRLVVKGPASQDYVSKAALNYAEQVLSKLSVK